MTQTTESQVPGEEQRADQAAGNGAGADQSGAASPGEGAGQEGDRTPPPSPPPPPAAAKPREDWRDQRIKQLTAQLNAERAKSQSRGADGQFTQNPASPPPPPVGRTYSDAELDAEAERRAQWRDFNRRCDETARQGQSEFGSEFNTRVQSLQGLFDRNNQQELGNFNSFLEAAIETGSGAALIHELGADRDRAMAILAMSPTRRAIELTKMADKIQAEKTTGANAGDEASQFRQPSGAPRPPSATVTSGRGNSHVTISPDDPDQADKLDIATWMARRKAQTKERGIR